MILKKEMFFNIIILNGIDNTSTQFPAKSLKFYDYYLFFEAMFIHLYIIYCFCKSYGIIFSMVLSLVDC